MSTSHVITTTQLIKNHPIRWFLSLLVLLITGSGCSRSLNQNQIDSVAVALSDSLAKVTVATDISLTLYEANRAAVYLTAPIASTYERENGATETLFSGGVLVTLIDSTGQRTQTTSEEVFYLSPESIFTLRNNVFIEGFNGRSMQTDTLVWDRNTQRIRTDGYVTMVTESDSIRGYGLRATTDLSDYSILRITGSATIRRNAN
jgi:LPS export ABC transporter protein LptC